MRVPIIVRYRGCRVLVLTAFWGTLIHLVVSPFNWIDKVIEDVGKKVGNMLDKEAGWDRTKKAAEEPILDGLQKKYPWWLSAHQVEGPATSSEKAGMDDAVLMFEDRNTRV